jgi:hypothetical protein
MGRRKKVAMDILDYCKNKGLRFYTTKYLKKEIVNSENGEKYNSYELAGGVKWLLGRDYLEKVSKKRYKINFDKIKKDI